MFILQIKTKINKNYKLKKILYKIAIKNKYKI